MSDVDPPAAPDATTPASNAERASTASRVWNALRTAPVTFALLAINVVVFVVAERHGRTTDTSTLLRFGAGERYHVWIGEYWRLLTPMFLHIGAVHLIWNGWASSGLCMAVESVMGSRRFLALYLAAGVTASAASTLFHDAVSAGASGALFGVIGATLVVRRRVLPSWRAFWAEPAVQRTLRNIAIWTVLGLTVVPMDNFAHAGGLAAGVAVTWAMTAPWPRQRRLTAAGLALAAFALVAARPWWRPSPAEANELASWSARYVHETGVPRNDARAAKLSDRACAAGSEAGCTVAAYLAETGRGVRLDPSRAVRLYRTSCERGYDIACVGLARLLISGEGVPPDASRAAYLLEKACAAGVVDGCGGIGFLRASGNGVPQDRRAGNEDMRVACAKGSRWSCELEKLSRAGAAASQ